MGIFQPAMNVSLPIVYNTVIHCFFGVPPWVHFLPGPHLWTLRIVFRTEKVHIRDLFSGKNTWRKKWLKFVQFREIGCTKIAWWFLRYPILQTRSRAKPESRSFPRHCPHLSKVTLCIFKNQGKIRMASGSGLRGWHLGVIKFTSHGLSLSQKWPTDTVPD